MVGTPDDCAAAMECLEELSGGFGGLLVMVQDWATCEQQRRSYDLLARYVMLRYTGALAGVESAYGQGLAQRHLSQQAMKQAIEQA